MTKAYSVRLDDTLVAKVDHLAEMEHRKRSDLIKEGLELLIREKEAELYRQESLLTREESLKTAKAFDEAVDDGL